MSKAKTNVTVAGSSFTRESLKTALNKSSVKAILAGYGNRYYDSNWGMKTSRAPVQVSTLESLTGRSKWVKSVLVDAIVAQTFGDPLPAGARQLTPEEKAAKRKADAEAKAKAAAEAEKKRIAAAKEAMKFKPPKGPLKDLTEEEARYISKMVMEHPGGCDSGKKAFIDRLGLPKPPEIATVTVTYTIAIEDPTDITADRYGDKHLSSVATSRLAKKVKEAVPEATSANISAARVKR